jgi:hypothetical protein
VATTRPACSFRLQAELISFIAVFFVLSACAPHTPADDLTLSTKVKIELIADPRLAALHLDVSTLEGVVTLSGTAPAQPDVDRAIAAAKHVPGVRAVKSDVKVGG